MIAQVQTEVLGKLLVIQGTLSILPGQEAIAAFVRKALSQVPGVADVHFCFRGLLIPSDPPHSPVCPLCRMNPDIPCDANQLCDLEQSVTRCIPLRTAGKLYGFLILSVENPDVLFSYEPYIANIANVVATELERRDVQNQLQQILQGLEIQVAERTAELVQRNAALEKEIRSRKRLEEALRRSEERYRSLAIATTQIVWTTNAEGEVTDAMPSWRAFTGQSEAEVKGQEWCNALHPEDRQRILALWSQAVTTRTLYNTEYRLRRHDGEYRHVSVRGVPVLEPDGTIREWVGTCTDITERKQAEAALREASLYSRSLIEASIDPFVTINADGKITDVNRATEAVTGLAREQLIGSDSADYCTEPLKAHKGYQTVFAQGFLKDYPLAIRHASGRITDVLFNATLYCNEKGEVAGVFAVARDITERKQAEDALRQARDELETRVKERTSELAHANEALRREITERERVEITLKDADRRKDEFLATLAHELRNPLAPIRTAVELLKLQPVPTHPYVQQARDAIDRQLRHLTRLVDDLLDVARITCGHIRLQKTPVELVDIINQAVETLRPLIHARRHALTVTLLQQPLRLEADPVRLAQVIGNLLDNAAKYTEEGGLIGLNLARTGDEAVVTVRDTGVGIPAEMLPRIFDLFTQTRHSAGMGLGLTLVRRLVEMHGGSVQAISDGIGQGSHFVVRLPLLPEVTQQAPELVSPVVGHPSRAHRILVVDDNIDAADSLAMLLQAMRHKVHTVYDGRAALDAVSKHSFDIGFLDIGMPGMNGYEVAQRLRAMYPPDQMVLIALSGYGQEEDRRQSKQAGFDHHLLKPVDFQELTKLLASKNHIKQVIK